MYVSVPTPSVDSPYPHGLGAVRRIRLPLVIPRRRGVRGMGAATYNPLAPSTTGADLSSAQIAVLLGNISPAEATAGGGAMFVPDAALPTSLAQQAIATNAALFQRAMSDPAFAAQQIQQQLQEPVTPADIVGPSGQLSAVGRSSSGAGAPPLTGGSSSPAPGGSGGKPRSVSISGSSFNVGDNWTITVTGPPNSPVVGSAVFNGASQGSAPFGSTDSSGTLTINGQMTAGQVGTWFESWTVGGAPAGTVSFTVAAPAPAGGAGSSSSSTSAPSGSSSSSSSSTSTSTPSFDLGGLISQPINLFGFSFPLWGIVAVAGGGLWLATSGRRGR